MTQTVVEELWNVINFYFICVDSNDQNHSEIELIVRDIERAQEKCAILKQVYNTIAIDLKAMEKNEAKASYGMEGLTIKYKQEEEYLKAKAQLLMELPSKEYGKSDQMIKIEFQKFDVDWSGFLPIEHVELATPQMENDKAVILTKESLIPSVNDFIKAVEAFSVFFTDVKESKIKNKKNSSARKPSLQTTMNPYYEQLNSDSCKFLKIASLMSSKFLSLPTDPNDKNYANQWFHQQKQ